MKVAIINGSLPHYDHGLSRVVSVIARTLAELGVELDEMNLGYSQIPYFDGVQSHAMDDFVMRLRASEGVVFACTSQLYAPSAMLQTFMEFFGCDQYLGALAEKHCLLTMVSKAGGERGALEYLARTISHLGGYESGRIGLQEAHARSIVDVADSPAGSVNEIVERAAEDFYRAVRQNRKYIVPADFIGQGQAPPALAPMPAYPTAHIINEPQMPQMQALPLNEPQMQQIQQMPQMPQMQASHVPTTSIAHQPAPAPAHIELPPKLNLDDFTERQEQDIKELTDLFSQKYVQPDDIQYSRLAPSGYQMPPQAQTPLQMPQAQEQTQAPYQQFPQPIPIQPSLQPQPPIQPPLQPQPPIQPQYQTPLPYNQPLQALPEPKPQIRSIKQLTQNLPHYYQPQMASGLTAIIQFSITGAETFDGYLTIVDNECEYTEGQAENPEITIISDSNTWHDVLKGKHTAQKAFMIGGLKVRGNFVLLTKFDTLFKM